VREGETVVVGIQNAEGSTLMTLADMSVITAEVKVDETDIVNVALSQSVDVTVDALPGKVFKGHVTEVGDQALLRTTGVATSQSTTGTEEAKDFKVVVTLDPMGSGQGGIPDQLRPGLSCTAKITTAEKPNALTIPIQALIQRDPVAEAQLYKDHGKVSSNSVVPQTNQKRPLVQGVYLLVADRNRLRVRFVPIATGVTGTTDIEVTGGIEAGQEIVTGRYKILRTLKSGTAVKRDNSIQTALTSNDSSS
jgi:HlyD family secretion protein